MSGMVRITQLDGKLPNLALMRLAAWHRAQGDDVRWQRGVTRSFNEPAYDVVYGSAIFAETAKAAAMLAKQFPGAIIGGTGGNRSLRVEQIVPSQFTVLDYSGYPDFAASIGYAMRGCRFKCGFCIVPKMEGKARAEGTIAQIWRGDGHPKHVHLLDNDFFGNPVWRDRVAEIEQGGFKVCINQGINVRLLDDEQAEAVVRVAPWDDQFNRRRLYTAWDNIGDETVFFDGLDRLEQAGWKADWTFVYMLVGYDRRETWERIFHRFNRMIARGVRPYPMVYAGTPERPTVGDYRKLKRFQRWVVTGAHKVSPFEEYSTARVRVLDAPLFERTAA
jgi:hypothetical protein